MLIAFLLALAFHASDSIQPVERLPIPQMENVCIDPPPVPPLFKALLGIGGFAAGIGLIVPVGTIGMDATSSVCNGNSCPENRLLGGLAGVAVLAILPVLGYKIGSKLDLKLVRQPNRVGLQLSFPIDAITSRRKTAVGSADDAKTLAYASGKY